MFTLIDPKSVWVLAYIDESKAGEIHVGEPAEFVLRSLPRQRLQGHVARIEPESDRVNEERRVEIAFDRIPDSFNLGEQAEVYIRTQRLPQALLVPEAAIEGLGQGRGTIWTVEDGRLQKREVTLGHRLLDGRYEIAGGLPDKALAVDQLRSGLRIGRAANIAMEPRSRSGVSRHQAQSAAFRPDELRIQPAARHCDRDHRGLRRPDRRRAEAGPRGRRGFSGWCRPAPTDLSPSSSRIPGDTREIVARVYGVEGARSPTNRSRPS